MHVALQNPGMMLFRVAEPKLKSGPTTLTVTETVRKRSQRKAHACETVLR